MLALQYEAWNELRQQEIAAKQQQPLCLDGQLLIVEHPPTITLGRSDSGEHFKVADQQLIEKGIERYSIRRGGQTTYHGPGQVVAYVILHLGSFHLNVRSLVSRLEKAMAATCAHFGVEAKTSCQAGKPVGLWVEDRKIAQLGIAIRRGICYHGVALNGSVDLSYLTVLNPAASNKPRSLASQRSSSKTTNSSTPRGHRKTTGQGYCDGTAGELGWAGNVGKCKRHE